MSLRLVTTPAEYPLSVEDAKIHLRVQRTDHDAYIGALIAAAFTHVERSTGRLFVPQTWEVIVDAFPTAEIAIPIGPVSGIVSVTYVDADGVTQTIAPELYELDSASETGWVLPVDGWPTPLETVNAVAVRFTVGGGMLPPDISQAVRLLLGLWYDTAAAATAEPMAEVPLAFEAIIAPYRRHYV